MARAYAFSLEGVIDIRTVSQTITGVKVNAIVLISQQTLFPTNSWPDELIDKAFELVTQGQGAVIPVVVTEQQ